MMNLPFYYLDQQFGSARDAILAEVAAVVDRGDFTLGQEVDEFERAFAAYLGVREAIGVNSGTDAIKLSLKAVGVGYGDEVITAANTFIATVGAIAELGATPVFVDCDETMCIDVAQIEAVITTKTRAIVPVHLSGTMCDMASVNAIAAKHKLHVVEDACQAFASERDGRKAGTWGRVGTFSLHPMKFINIWGDGGVIVTDDVELAAELRLLRNHGLKSRDEIVLLGYNSRLDTIQAVVAKHVLRDAPNILAARHANAALYDAAFAKIEGLQTPVRPKHGVHSFVTYQVFAAERDALLHHCLERGIDCKIHYPVPVYRQKGLGFLGYKEGAFPTADRQAKTCMTLPVHQYLRRENIEEAVLVVKDFFQKVIS